VNTEKYTTRVQELSLNVVQTEIDAIRKKDITKTGLRVYRDGKIGVAGAIGPYDEGELTQKAIDALALGIPYPFDISSYRVGAVEPESDLPEEQAFVSEMEQMLTELRGAQPSFSFSDKIALRTEDVRLVNDRGLNLQYSSTSIEMGLSIKDKGSSNILDAWTGYDGWRYDRAEFLRLTNVICDAYRRQVDIEKGTHPVFFLVDDYVYLGKLMESLHGLLYGTGSSLFSGKMGEKLFADHFTVRQSRHWQDGVIGPFFDTEGTVNEGYRFNLIQDGVLLSPMTDKKHATKFDLPLTGSAGGDYDSVPTLGRRLLIQIASTGKTMKELLDGEQGVLVWIASGGDFTPDGHFATPVQLAYLFDGETLVGRLPELNISSHLYDMFGKDFIGVSTDSLTSLGKLDLIAMNMEVSKAK
jgi:PmbA protein